MEKRTAVIPDFNMNEQIESISQTAGAYAGAVVTAVVGGLMTGLTSLFRGAVEGAKATYANAGNQQVEVQNTSAAAKASKAANNSHINLQIDPEYQEFLASKRRQADLAGSTNGNGH